MYYGTVWTELYEGTPSYTQYRQVVTLLVHDAEKFTREALKRVLVKHPQARVSFGPVGLLWGPRR